ncbi:MAG: MMPL family transporter [Bacteroides sp.]|nr:MMPL family transporter [Prevotella sp.]MCM1406863.1 MMPL family transporter [Treponema brennaborense]MCM1470808.1 MMPL family transporter [Bacteroides sp.]
MKKNLFLNKNKSAWFYSFLIFHFGIAAAFLVSLFFAKGINFDADYTNMLPAATESKAAKIAEKAILSASNSTVFILVGHENFGEAKACAENAYSLLNDRSKFRTLTLYQDFSSVKEIQTFLGEYRFSLLNEDVREKLENGKAPDFAQNALEAIYGSFSFADFDNLEDDPFLLDEINFNHYSKTIAASQTAMNLKEGVFAGSFGGKWYVLIKGELTKDGARLMSKTNAVPFIYEKCLPLEKDGIQFVFHGVPFHSCQSSSSALNEISVISSVSLCAVILILFFVFRSAVPIFASLFSILLSIGAGFCATHVVFGEIQMIALVFGTSLIGSCIDYSLHFFINWKASKNLDSAEKIRKHIFNGLILSLVSTELCFILLLFTPFKLLKQMAVFSFTGILSSFLTVNGFFTEFEFPPKEKRTIPLLEKLDRKIPRKNKIGRIAVFAVFCAAALFLIPNFEKVQIKNDVSNLYEMQDRLKSDFELANKILSYNLTSWLVVEGDSIEEVLQTEEKLIVQIPDNFICTAKFIPSIENQKKSLAASEKLLPLAKTQFEYFGFDSESENKFYSAFEKAKTHFLTPESEMPKSAASYLENIWLGKIDGKYYSVLLPSFVSDEIFYEALAEQFENVHYENRIRDKSSGLDKLTAQILVMFAIAFAVIGILMKFFYSWKDTLKIISIPILSVLIIFCVFVFADLKIEFFCVTGIILVFGLGLDYVIYKTENKENFTEIFAIALSFFTTAISFGSLALSSFVPVHVLGLSIFSGLTAAFIAAIL